MLAKRCIVLAAGYTLAATLMAVGYAQEGEFATRLDPALLDRVRGLDDYSAHDDINVGCAIDTWDEDVVYECEGEDDGTECHDCVNDANGRLAKLPGDSEEGIMRFGGAFVCSNLTAFSGTCEDGVCVGDDDDDCEGTVLVYKLQD